MPDVALCLATNQVAITEAKREAEAHRLLHLTNNVDAQKMHAESKVFEATLPATIAFLEKKLKKLGFEVTWKSDHRFLKGHSVWKQDVDGRDVTCRTEKELLDWIVGHLEGVSATRRHLTLAITKEHGDALVSLYQKNMHGWFLYFELEEL